MLHNAGDAAQETQRTARRSARDAECCRHSDFLRTFLIKEVLLAALCWCLAVQGELKREGDGTISRKVIDHRYAFNHPSEHFTYTTSIHYFNHQEDQNYYVFYILLSSNHFTTTISHSSHLSISKMTTY